MPDTPENDPPIDLTPNPLIKKLKSYGVAATEAHGPESAVTLLGYLGDSSDTDQYIQLYLRLDLKAYYRILKTDLIYSVAVNDADPSQPTKVVVRASAQIEIVQTSEASFLSGNVAATHSGALDATTAAWGAITATTIETGPHCNSIDCAKFVQGSAGASGRPHEPDRPTGPHCQ